MMPLALLNSPAYKALSPSAAKALPLFFAKVKFVGNFYDPDRYSVDFSFSYKEAKSHRFAYSTFAKIISCTMSTGFLDPVDKGGLRGDSKSSNKFRLSRRWEKFGTEEFTVVNWKEFQPPIPTGRNSKK